MEKVLRDDYHLERRMLLNACLWRGKKKVEDYYVLNDVVINKGVLARIVNLEVFVNNHILVTELKDNTFYAVISLVTEGNTLMLDSRPSDAIALALRTKAPIYVEEKVIEAAKSLDLPDPDKTKTDEKKQWKDWLSQIKPQDFGKL